MVGKFAARIDDFNDRVADSFVGRFFRLDGSGHKRARPGAKFTTEIRAGITTFVAMAYIISVNSLILKDSGGPCVCNPADPTDTTCSRDEAYALCQAEFQRDLITATSAIACIGSLLMGFMANLPVAVAPGLGLNAYFSYSVVGIRGTGKVSYEDALGAVFLEGIIFIALALFGVRAWLARLIPRSVALAAGAGIGLYISLIGLSSNGLSVIGGDYDNLLGLGGCRSEDQDPEHKNYCRTDMLMRSPTMWLGIFLGGIVTVYLMLYRVKGSMLIGILLVSIVSWPRKSDVTYFPDTAVGNSNFDFFKKVVTFRKLKMTGAVLNFNYRSGHIWLALISFLYVDLLDATGTLYSMARFAGVMNERTLDFEHSTWAYTADAASISIGSLMGSSPATAFIESAAGIAEGGKTGITAITSGFCFFISIFFSPIFASFPSWATGGTLVIVGSLMAKNIVDINWSYVGDAIPAFLTLIMMPFGYNIAYGLIAGLLSYLCLNLLPWGLRWVSGGRISPPDWDKKDPYWESQRAYLVPGWLRRLIKGDKKFWRGDDYDEEFDDYPMEDGESVNQMHRTRTSGTTGTGSLDADEKPETPSALASPAAYPSPSGERS